MPGHQTLNAQHRLAEYDRWAALVWVPGPQIPDVAWSALAMPRFNVTRLSRDLTEPQLLRTERVHSPFAQDIPCIARRRFCDREQRRRPAIEKEISNQPMGDAKRSHP